MPEDDLLRDFMDKRWAVRNNIPALELPVLGISDSATSFSETANTS